MSRLGRPRLPDCLPVQVIRNNHELRAVLSEICLAEGFKVSSGREFTAQWQDRLDRSGSGGKPDVDALLYPVLVSDWPRLLKERTELGPVVSSLGFAHGAMVGQGQGVRSRGMPGSAPGRQRPCSRHRAGER